MYIIVVGCGRVGSHLAQCLSTEGHNVVVIDKNPSSFRRLGSTFNGLTIEGVGFDEDVLKQAEIEKADALAAVTDLDNTNMMIVEMATKLFDVPRAIARLYNPERERTYQQLGLSYVCGTILTAEKILDKIIEGYVRHVSVGEDAEIIEFEAGKFLNNKKVEEIDILDELKISTIVRRGESIIPLSSFTVKENDHIFCTIKRYALPKIEKFIKD
ncbi:NAD-binding protein [Candidatus Oleimmundimicrobium sp.]|uniref:NAD-binding protein n=1 Tax=Candidatus Oleimmundimicrobium sp. TaxID=3060597 RepID=UPI002724FB5F|nr:NAD-binding protein [Candidatus Oleimmundimicrobium sp.]MDO8886843.1 NAD-binding protein [Candidatus Oleimmundimicrobium sp.]